MTEYRVVPATEEYIDELAYTMRQDDVNELWAAYHMKPSEALHTMLKASRDTILTGLADGRVVCMFGTCRVCAMGVTGYPWLLGAEELPKHAKAFLRLNKDYIEYVREEFDNLVNYVDVRNKQAIRWLKWLGFTLHNPAPFGWDQLPFHKFEMKGYM